MLRRAPSSAGGSFMSISTDRSTFLRRSLQLDGLASGLCGALLLVAAPTIAGHFGVAGTGIPRAVGAGLLVVVDGPLTVIGNVAVAVIAAAVLVFAVLEVMGLRRLRTA